MPTITVDPDTFDAIDKAALYTGQTHDLVIRHLMTKAESALVPPPVVAEYVDIYADYQGIRTHARFNVLTHAITITDGPLASTKPFKSPSGAAQAVVAHYNPSVKPNRAGWSFWTLDDGTGRLLQTIRP